MSRNISKIGSETLKGCSLFKGRLQIVLSRRSIFQSRYQHTRFPLSRSVWNFSVLRIRTLAAVWVFRNFEIWVFWFGTFFETLNFLLRTGFRNLQNQNRKAYVAAEMWKMSLSIVKSPCTWSMWKHNTEFVDHTSYLCRNFVMTGSEYQSHFSGSFKVLKWALCITWQR